MRSLLHCRSQPGNFAKRQAGNIPITGPHSQHLVMREYRCAPLLKTVGQLREIKTRRSQIMNRRDLLKQAGATMLAASSVGVSSLVYAKPPEEDLQDLVVTFSGPFCYWVEQDYLRIMALLVAGNICLLILIMDCSYQNASAP